MYKKYLEELVKQRELPGGVLAVTKKRKLQFLEVLGSFVGENQQVQAFTKDTLFDVASLTKVIATLPATLFLHSQKKVQLDDDVKVYLPEFRYSNVKIEHLLTHTSGLPPDLPYKERGSPRDVLAEIYRTELQHVPGRMVSYSDLGMILLGKLIEKVSGQPLDAFTKEHIFTPWGLHKTGFGLEDKIKTLAASTEKSGATFIQGEVHDEKAFHLGGVSGSAGLFSSVDDVSTYALHLLYPEEQKVIPPSLIRLATKHRKSNRGLGFEVWNGEGDALSCGERWPVGSFGHTGFTGTSVWINPEQELVVVFLTNAVHYGRNTKIRTIRKTLHSMIYSSITEEFHK